MGALADRIRDQIQANGGWLGFDAFMQSALYWPNLGYYCGGGRPFGDGKASAGDFVTAPVLGPWLAQGIWSWLAPLRAELALRRLPSMKSAGFHVREFGAGRGDLAAELLRASNIDLSEINGSELCMEMVELSADMQQLQRARTQGLGSVVWSTSMTDGFSGLVIANEVLDAMPVRCFEWAGAQTVLEWGVACDAASASGFDWVAKPADQDLTAAVLARRDAALRRGLPWAEGYRGEHASWMAPWLAGLAASMHSGAVLIIDYGHERHELDHPGRTDGSLCAHRQHRRIDDRGALLADPGQQDLTAHVDFSLAAASAKTAGFDVSGFVTQARFLMNTGLLDRAQSVMDQVLDVTTRTKLTQSLQMMLSESEMGEVFKVMLLTKGISPQTVQALMERGFDQGNRIESLIDAS